jgi:tRNA 5-methylaminomethyl-2-thiouridine biosynthesis bifunctional protein
MAEPSSGLWRVDAACLTWTDDGAPKSEPFADSYAVRTDPLGEARHVVLDGLDAPALWSRPGPLLIAETGFGIGLNFLTFWDHWRRAAPPGGRLHWWAVEGFPVTRAELVRALARHPSLTDPARRLALAWPPPQPGLHVRAMAPDVTLTLAFGPVETALEALDRPADAWVLDGFAPARNPAMWSERVLALVGDRARPGAPLSTYTSAGAVRRGLEAAGFDVRRVPGFGGKRDSLRATRIGAAATPKRRSARIAIIGAGIAGCALAAALRRRGAGDVAVVDARGDPGEALPPALLALLEPRLEKGESPAAHLHALAAPTAAALYDGLALAGVDPWRGPRGVLSADRGRRDDAWRAAAVERLAWPPDWLALLERDAAAARVGAPPPGGSALWHPHGGCLAPAVLLPALLAETAVIAAAVASVEPAGTGWRLLDADGAVILEADEVVLCAATDTARLWPAAGLPIRPTRGQVSLLRASGADAAPRVAVSSGAYVTPPVADGAGGWWRVLGATHTPWRGDPAAAFALAEGDDAAIRAALAQAWPTLADALAREPTTDALAGLRATLPDHLPLAGPLFDARALAQSHGARARRDGRATAPPQPGEAGAAGLWTLSGLGSHGLALAPLLAEHLAAALTEAPAVLTPDLARAVHPARFALRAMARGG